MARFHGEVGYVETVETAPGVHEEQPTERTYFGDEVRIARRLQQEDEVNPNVVLQNSISIVADAYANEHIFAIRYVRWQGTLWNVTKVDIQRPRLILTLGGVYNGITP